jgi:hypothetical protein
MALHNFLGMFCGEPVDVVLAIIVVIRLHPANLRTWRTTHRRTFRFLATSKWKEPAERGAILNSVRE